MDEEILQLQEAIKEQESGCVAMETSTNMNILYYKLAAL